MDLYILFVLFQTCFCAPIMIAVSPITDGFTTFRCVCGWSKTRHTYDIVRHALAHLVIHLYKHNFTSRQFFYMLRGGMCLRVIEEGKQKDIVIREGECFLLPGKVPHSPQRQRGTIGFVIERERLPNEVDGLRFYIDGTTEPLFERWFHCENLGTQLQPIIEEYFNSLECMTQMPTPCTCACCAHFNHTKPVI